MTPFEQLALKKMIAGNPAVQQLITRLDLDLSSPSEAYKHSLTVKGKIDTLWDSLAKADSKPVVQRSVVKESSTPQIFRTAQEISAWIKQTSFSL